MSYLSNGAPSRDIEPDYKVGKLIPLLGSDNPGEILSTVAAIDRRLKATNRDWHDLAEALADADSPRRGGGDAGLADILERVRS
jgi:hypothetical protein